MAIVQDGILWPLRFSSTLPGDLVVSVTGGAPVQQTLTFPTVTLLRNYYAAYDQQADADTDGGEGDVMELFLTMLNTHTATGTFSISDASGTGAGQTKITHDTEDFIIEWTDAATTLDAYSHYFGWDGTADITSTNDGGSEFVLAANNAAGIWRPGCYRSEDSRPQTPMVGGSAMTAGGETRAVRLTTPAKHRDVAWVLLNQAKVLSEFEATTDPYGAFETAWDQAVGIGTGERFRLYNDISVRTGSSDYDVYRFRQLNPPHQQRDNIEPTLWQVSPVPLVAAGD